MPPSREIDAELMDFLYGELSDADADRFRERLSADAELSAEVEAFQRTRDAFKALPVEEPPPAVSAQLLHEAAKRAPARKRAQPIEERPGLWAAVVELFQPLLRHPAAASVAALLLVGGVAGALYLRGVDSPAHPTADSHAPAPGIAAPDEPRNSAFARIDGLDVDEGGRGDVTLETQPSAGYLDTGVEDSEDNSELHARLAEPEQEKALRETTGESQRWSVNEKADEGRRGGATPKGTEPLANAVSGADPLVFRDEVAKADPAPPPASDKPMDGDGKLTLDIRDKTTSKDVAGKKGKREQGVAERAEPESEQKSVAQQAMPLRKSKESSAPAKAPTARTRSFSAADEGGDFGVADDDADMRAPEPQTSAIGGAASGAGGGSYRSYKNKDDQWAKSQHGVLNRTLDSKATKKSQSKRCREAAQIANDILDRNPEYYTSKVKDSKWLQPCSGFVATERTLRARKRSGTDTGKANAAKAKKKAGTDSTKAKAAPAEMDSAETE